LLVPNMPLLWSCDQSAGRRGGVSSRTLKLLHSWEPGNLVRATRGQQEICCWPREAYSDLLAAEELPARQTHGPADTREQAARSQPVPCVDPEAPGRAGPRAWPQQAAQQVKSAAGVHGARNSLQPRRSSDDMASSANMVLCCCARNISGNTLCNLVQPPGRLHKRKRIKIKPGPMSAPRLRAWRTGLVRHRRCGPAHALSCDLHVRCL